MALPGGGWGDQKQRQGPLTLIPSWILREEQCPPPPGPQGPDKCRCPGVMPPRQELTQHPQGHARFPRTGQLGFPDHKGQQAPTSATDPLGRPGAGPDLPPQPLPTQGQTRGSLVPTLLHRLHSGWRKRGLRADREPVKRLHPPEEPRRARRHRRLGSPPLWGFCGSP